MMRLLFIGDIVGRPGRDLVRHGLQAIVERHQIDLVIANAENAAAGFGITREIGDLQRVVRFVDVDGRRAFPGERIRAEHPADFEEDPADLVGEIPDF